MGTILGTNLIVSSQTLNFELHYFIKSWWIFLTECWCNGLLNCVPFTYQKLFFGYRYALRNIVCHHCQVTKLLRYHNKHTCQFSPKQKGNRIWKHPSNMLARSASSKKKFPSHMDRLLIVFVCLTYTSCLAPLLTKCWCVTMATSVVKEDTIPPLNFELSAKHIFSVDIIWSITSETRILRELHKIIVVVTHSRKLPVRAT